MRIIHLLIFTEDLNYPHSHKEDHSPLFSPYNHKPILSIHSKATHSFFPPFYQELILLSESRKDQGQFEGCFSSGLATTTFEPWYQWT